MALLLKNYGLEFLTEDEDMFMGFLAYLVKEGKEITGYYGMPYFYKSMGNVEFWVRAERDEEGNLSVSGAGAHCGGACVWDVVHSGIDITPKDASKLERIIMVHRKDGRSGLLPIDMITADVLPSFLKGDHIKVQVIAQPLSINYYANEDEYKEAQPEDENGEKWMIGNGSLLPMSFLYNHAPERYEQGKDYESDSYIQFNATVTGLYHGTFEMGDKEGDMFIRCFADTEYGELEFDHSREQVPEEQRRNIKIGSVISGVCILSGDVAICEYERGAIRDFEHDLRLLRYTFVKGEAERLRGILSETAIYETDKSYSGRDQIIERIDFVHENTKKEYFAHLATITEADHPDYPVGTRCIVLASGGENNYESIAFITVNDDGLIEKIKISRDGGYRFKIDAPAKITTPLDDLEIPDSVIEPVILRAKFHGLIDEALEPEAIINDIPDYRALDNNARWMLEALREHPQPDIEIALGNIFGYLFAKAMEQEINENKENPEVKTRLTVSYYPAEAFSGEITSTLSKDEHEKLVRAMELGKQFLKDLKFFIPVKDIGEEEFVSVFQEAAIVVQRIGQLAAKSFFQG